MPRHQQAPLRRFERMSRLKDYTVDKGLTDPRGWKVLDAAGQAIGRVQDLVIDTDRMAATYLEVELDSRSFGHEDPLILVPMTRAERDGTDDRLVVRDLTRSRITALFDARAAHEASFWEEWWRDPAGERPGDDRPHDRALRAVPRPVEPLEADRPRDVVFDERPVTPERVVARSDERLPAVAAPDYPRNDYPDESDPLEDPHYRRTPDPGDRRRFDE